MNSHQGTAAGTRPLRYTSVGWAPLEPAWRACAIAVGATVLAMWFFYQVALPHLTANVMIHMGRSMSDVDRILSHRPTGSWRTYTSFAALAAVRLIVTALLLQIPLLLRGDEIPLRQLLRVASWAAIVALAEPVARSIYLLCLPVSAATLAAAHVIPFSAAHLWLPAVASVATASPMFLVLQAVNPYQLAWGVALAVGLVRICHISRRVSALIGLTAIGMVMFVSGALGTYGYLMRH